MEPTLTTAAHLNEVLEELKRREPLFHRPELGTSRRDFENMTDASFWEVGASGRRYSREFILDTLQNRRPQLDEDTWQTRGFHCLEIAADNYLVTYTLHQGHLVAALGERLEGYVPPGHRGRAGRIAQATQDKVTRHHARAAEYL
jgi:hypothetical protein